MHRSCQTFTCFPRLPTELRDEIWDAAIRNRQATPLAHFFTLQDSDVYKYKKLREVSKQNLSHWVDRYTSLGPPPTGSSPEPNNIWNHPSNSSAYLWDSGLWGACVESRAAVVRRWKLFHGLSCCLGFTFSDDDESCPGLTPEAEPRWLNRCKGDNDHLRNPYRSVVCKFPDHDLGDRWIVTKPEVDLFICDIPNLPTFDGWSLIRTRTWFHVDQTIANLVMRFDPKWTYSVPDNNDEWEYLLEERSGGGGFARIVENLALEPYSRSRLWLIDYGLQPEHELGLRELVKDRQVFRAQGHWFIEVREEDMRQRWVPQRRHEPTAHEFLDAIFRCGYGYYHNEAGDETPPGRKSGLRDGFLKICTDQLVLACLLDDHPDS